jgi:aspartyl-tRNA(Asn)/glutamyl-tRNA(Gln) amidotransferase subunit A
VNGLHQRSAHAIAADVREGRISALDVCKNALAQIERLGRDRSGFTQVLRKRALLRAEAVDKIVAAGLDPGALAGVPFGVAALFDVAGQVTTAGSVIRARSPFAHADARAIALLEAAGAVLVGTQNMDEFSYGFVTVNAHYGTSLNPHDNGRLAGGAAGGSAVAVATGCVPISIAFDTNGSLRVPAALCGVMGLKPTYGDLPRQGAFPFVDSLDVIGPLARDLDDLALVRRILRQDKAEPASTQHRPLRFCRLLGWFSRNIEEEFLAPLDDLWGALGRVSFELEHVELARAAASLIIAAEGANLHRARLEEDPMAFDPATRDRFLAGLLLPADDYVQAQRFRSWIRRRSLVPFEHCDVLITPAAPGYAPRIADPTMAFDGGRVPARSHLGIYTQPISLIGLPALVLPLAHGGPLPLGIQLVAAAGGEQSLFEAARFLLDSGFVAVPTPRMAD